MTVRRRGFGPVAPPAAMRSAPVHTVLGRHTTYVAGRRLLLATLPPGGRFQLTEEIAQTLPALVRDESREMALRAPLLGERTANLLARGFAPALAWRRYWASFAVLAAFAVGLGGWAVARTSDVATAPLTWTTVVVHYLVLIGIVGWHEIGHLAAARRAGLRVDGVGVGLYLIFPALFSKISLLALATYRDRMKIFSAGVAFQLALGCALAGALVVTEHSLLRFALIANFSTALVNLIPGAKLDGQRMVDEVIAQPWSARYRRPLRLLTQISSFALVGLAFALIVSWSSSALPAALSRPTILGATAALVPIALLLLMLRSLARGLVRRHA